MISQERDSSTVVPPLVVFDILNFFLLDTVSCFVQYMFEAWKTFAFM